MRTMLLMFLIVTYGLSRNLHIVRTNGNSTTNKAKKGEAAIKTAKKHSITTLRFRSPNPNVKLYNPPTNMVIRTGRVKHTESRLPVTSQKPKQDLLTTYKRDTPPLAALLPKVPVVKYSPLLHLECILPIKLTQPLIPTSTRCTDENRSTQTNLSNSSTLTKIRHIITNKKHYELKKPLPSETCTSTSGLSINNSRELNFFWPVETRTISSGWGPRIRTHVVNVKINGRSKRHKKVLRQSLANHTGIDLSAPQGSAVFAVMDGQIESSANHKHYGNFIIIDHGNKVTTLYGHCHRNVVTAGEIVRRGQKIAEVGRTGNATGPHVHFELRINGSLQNPLPFMKDTEETPTTVLTKNQPTTPTTSYKR